MSNSVITPMFQPEIETMSREEIRALQLAKLKDQVAWTYERVPWYREKMGELGVVPGDIQTLEDIRKLPFTDKSVLRDTYPFGLFAIPLDDVVRLHASSGTTGKPIVVGYNDHDLDIWRDCIARLAQMAGVVPSDRVQMAFGYGMFTGGFGLHYGLEHLGCMVIPAGSGNTERHLMMINDYQTTVLIATPSYAMHMCEYGEKHGFDWENSSLRIGLFGGEPCPPALKEEIERRMHIICTDNYGLTEVMGPGVSGECLACRDMQHIAEDHFFWEIVDPKTGEPRLRACGRAGAHAARQAGVPRLALSHARPELCDHRTMRMRAYSCAYEEGSHPHRRHAHHPRNERIPFAGRRHLGWHRRREPALSYRGR